MLPARQTLTNHLTEAISFAELDRFAIALFNYDGVTINTMWKDYPLLRTWYSSKPVSFINLQEKLTIPLTTLIPHFGLALLSGCPDLIHAMWSNSKLLRNWYRSKPVLPDESGQIKIAIAFDELIMIFGCVLLSGNENIIKVIWNANPALQQFYRGDLQPEYAFANFMFVLPTKNSYILSAIWQDNKNLMDVIKSFPFDKSKDILLQVINSGRDTSVGCISAFIMQYVAWLDDIALIEAVLKDIQDSLDNAKDKKLLKIKREQIKFLTNRLNELKPNESQLIENEVVELQTNEGENVNSIRVTISVFQNDLESFRTALTTKNHKAAYDRWCNNPLLQAWYSSKPLSFKKDNQVEVRVVSFDDLNSIFKSALGSLCRAVILALWHHNPLLQDRYTGRKVISDEVIIYTISRSLITNFKSVLGSQVDYIIETIWSGASLLQDWYRGRGIFFDDEPGQAKLQFIKPDELIIAFKSILSSQNRFTINAVWHENINLQNAIRESALPDKIAVLQRVMHSQDIPFNTIYINWLEDPKPIEAVLKEIEGSLSSYYQIVKNLLLDRLSQLNLEKTLFDEVDASCGFQDITDTDWQELLGSFTNETSTSTASLSHSIMFNPRKRQFLEIEDYDDEQLNHSSLSNDKGSSPNSKHS